MYDKNQTKNVQKEHTFLCDLCDLLGRECNSSLRKSFSYNNVIWHLQCLHSNPAV